MPVLSPKGAAPAQLRAVLGPAVGRSDDFWALGYCAELDERERSTDPDHEQFTFVFRYQSQAKGLIERVNARLDGLWQPGQGPLLAVGDPAGIIEIEPTGSREVTLGKKYGQFMAVWGSSDSHVFACGGAYRHFVLYRRYGQWVELPLPADTPWIYDVCGFHENEVYFAGEHGLVLLWDGQAFTRMQVPTTRYLTHLARLGDQYMCVSGYQGTLLMGNRRGWRLVPTQTEDDLLSIAELGAKVYYGTSDTVFSFDGSSAPVAELDTPARWISGLSDGLVIDDGETSKLFHGGTLHDLDTTV